MMDTNLKGTFFCSKYAFLHMQKVGYGRIVSITSIAGERGGFFSGIHYSTSKGGVAAMMKCFALNGAKYNITANSVSPGVVETEMSKREGIPVENIPLGRMAQPKEIAAAVCFLASENAGYITGATLDVNGGQLMR
jgi:3-oxoacyl-[acyl-carrier protein] reductase